MPNLGKISTASRNIRVNSIINLTNMASFDEERNPIPFQNKGINNFRMLSQTNLNVSPNNFKQNSDYNIHNSLRNSKI